MAVAALRRYTIEEWRAIEEETGQKCEYYRGEIFAMAGGSHAHNRLGANLSSVIGAALSGSECGGFSSDQTVCVEETGLYAYPDYTVVCGNPHAPEEDPHALTNPTFLAEVLSPSTERYDRGEKSRHYRLIPSLREYALISQDRAHVEIYTRQGDGSWKLREADGLNAALTLESLGCDLPLARLYERVEFPPQPETVTRQDVKPRP